MPLAHRRKPFSNKQKKIQLQERRARKAEELAEFDGEYKPKDQRRKKRTTIMGGKSELMNRQPNARPGTYDPNRYRLQFMKLSDEEIELGKKEAAYPTRRLPETTMEVDVDDVYQPGSVLDMPKRPEWDYSMGKTKLDKREEQYFADYCERVMESHETRKLSYFELNLETWRQLWRCLEMSDIVLLITDIRHPALHFSPTLYDHVVNDMKKHFILVLNKIDLAPPALVTAWKHYFKNKFPEIHVVTFTTIPRDDEEMAAMSNDKVFHKKRRRRRRTPAVGPKELWSVCDSIVKKAVNLSQWRDKIRADQVVIESDESDEELEIEDDDEPTERPDTSFTKHVPFKDGILTIGCCGYPNVGKSSLLNGLMGKKVVSVSRTPGHTKHFQTIFLTRNVRMCDSPGLVFPSLVNRSMQVLMGLYPVSQCREPFTAVRYLLEHMPLPTDLKVKHPEADEKPGQVLEWSSYDICEAFAVKMGFFTAKVARPDVHRAADFLLRMVVSGRLTLCMKPPGYHETRDHWESLPETEELAQIQLKTTFKRSISEECLKTSVEEEKAKEAKEAEEQDEEESESEESEDEEADQSLVVASSNPFDLLDDECP